MISWLRHDSDKGIKDKDLSEFNPDKSSKDMKFPVWYKEEYDLEAKKLPLIIFFHGLSGTKNQYSAMYREFASHGYLVLAIDSHCGSCCYTENEKGEPILFDAKPKFYDLKIRKK